MEPIIINHVIKCISKLNYSAVLELFLIIFLSVLFFDLAVLSPFIDKTKISFHTVIAIIILNIIFLFIISLLINNIVIKIKRVKTCGYLSIINQYINIIYFAKQNPVIIILFIYFFIRLFYLDVMLRWDGAYYFCLLIKSVEKFDFTINNFFKNFNWNGHPSMGYALIISLGQFVDLGNHCLLNIQNLILSLLTIFAFYKILDRLYGSNKKEILLLTALLAFNPLFFGVSLTFSLDFPLIVFWVLTIFAFLYKRMISLALFGTILVFSKETGALLYLTFLISLFLLCLLKHIRFNLDQKNNENNFLSNFACCVKKTLKSKGSLSCLMIPAVLFFLYLIYSKGQLWNGGLLSWNSSEFHNFGFNLKIILTRFAEIFILNFSWLQSFLMAAFLIKSSFRPARGKSFGAGKNRNLLIVLLIAFIVFAAVNFFYITWNHPRYILVSVFFLLIFSYYALLNVVGNKIARVVILVSMLILSVTQTFRTVDPLSKKIFNTLNFGNHQVLNIGPGDELVYNSEYINIERLLNKLNKKININEESKIILSDLNDNGWMAHFNGSEPHTYINIDKTSLKRTFKKENAFYPTAYPVWSINLQNIPAEPYYVFMSWFGNESAELEHLQNFYTITETGTINHHGYFFKLYKLKEL